MKNDSSNHKIIDKFVDVWLRLGLVVELQPEEHVFDDQDLYCGLMMYWKNR